MSNSKREVRVFISSTFNDLHSERNFLNNVVFPKVKSFCNENGLQFIPIDLRWGISKQEEKNGKVLERCLSEIDESRPYFIGILGQRYGWVPSVEDQVRINISDENRYAYALNRLKEKKSITHLEILHGVLNSPDMYDNSFFLFKNPSAVDSVPVDLQGPLKEKEQVFSDKLTGLKKKIVNGLPAEQISEYDCTFNGLKLDWSQTPEINLERSYKDKIIEICGKTKTKRISLEEYEKQSDGLKNVLSKYVEFLPASEVYELAAFYLLESMEKIWALSNGEFECLGHLLEDNHIDLEEFETLSDSQKQLVHHFGYVDFKGFEEMGEWLTESLIAEIKKDRLDGAESEVLTGTQLEESKHKSFQIEKLDAFVERPAVMKDLGEYINGDSDKPLLFTGRPGSGKSSIMAHLASKLEESNDVDLCLRFVGVTKKSNNIISLLVSIIEELEDRYEIERPVEYTVGSRINKSQDVQVNFSEENKANGSSIDQEPQKLFRYFEFVLRTVGNKSKLVLIFDAINQLSERDDAYLLTWLPFTCPENVKIICSSLPRKEDSEEMLSQNSIYESAERRELEILGISPLEVEEKKGIVTNILVEKYGKRQEAFPLDVLMRKEESDSPLYLYIASEELRTFFHFNEIAAFTANLPETTIGIIEQLLKRLELEFGEQLVRDSLSLIVSSLYGLSEFELGEILSGMYGENYQPQKWLALYHNLRPYLKRGTGDRSLIDFMHGQFVELVQKRYMPEKAMQFYYWNILGEYGEKNKGQYCLVYFTLAGNNNRMMNIINNPAFNGAHFNEILGLYINWLANYGQPNDYPSFEEVLQNLPLDKGIEVTGIILDELKDLGERNWEWELLVHLMKVDYLNGLLEQGENNDLKDNLAESYSRIAYIYDRRNMFDESLDYAKKGVELRMELGKHDPERYVVDLANLLMSLGSTYWNMNDYYQALEYQTEALEIFSNNVDLSYDVNRCKYAESLNSLALTYHRVYDLDSAFKYGLKAYDIVKSLSEDNPEDYRLLLSICMNSLSTYNEEVQEYDVALDFQLKALDICRRLSEELPELYMRELATCLRAAGRLYQIFNDYDSAYSCFNENLKILRKLSSQNPEVYLPSLSSLLNDLAVLNTDSDKLDDAITCQLECLDINEKLAQDYPDVYMFDMATSMGNLALVFYRMADYDTALKYQLKSVETFRKLIIKNTDSSLPLLAVALTNLANIYEEFDEIDSAITYHLESLEIKRTLCETDPELFLEEIAISLSNLGCLYSSKLKNHESSVECLHEAVEIRRKLVDKYPEIYLMDLCTDLDNLRVSYLYLNDIEKANFYKQEIENISK